VDFCKYILLFSVKPLWAISPFERAIYRHNTEVPIRHHWIDALDARNCKDSSSMIPSGILVRGAAPPLENLDSQSIIVFDRGCTVLKHLPHGIATIRLIYHYDSI
jgi:hypothetical protein